MGTVSVVCVILACLLFLAGRSCNGKGPEAGFAGIIMYLAGAGFALVSLVTFAFWLGTQQ